MMLILVLCVPLVLFYLPKHKHVNLAWQVVKSASLRINAKHVNLVLWPICQDVIHVIMNANNVLTLPTDVRAVLKVTIM